jgi:hypothetical protein
MALLLSIERIRNAFFEAGKNTRLALACLSGPTRHGLGSPVCGDKMSPAGVAHLFLFGGPSAIIFAVSLVVVYALQGHVFIWSLAHIAQECFKRIPFLAYGNAPSAIVCMSFVIGIVAACAHCAPRNIGKRTASERALPMSGYSFLVETATALVLARFEIVGERNACVPALAFAKPPDLYPAVRRAGNNRNTTKNLARKINKFNSMIIADNLTFVSKGTRKFRII